MFLEGQQLSILQPLTTLNGTVRLSYTWLWGCELPHSPLQMARRVGRKGREGRKRKERREGGKKEEEEEVVTCRLLEKRGTFLPPLCSLGTSRQMMVVTLT